MIFVLVTFSFLHCLAFVKNKLSYIVAMFCFSTCYMTAFHAEQSEKTIGVIVALFGYLYLVVDARRRK